MLEIVIGCVQEVMLEDLGVVAWVMCACAREREIVCVCVDVCACGALDDLRVAAWMIVPCVCVCVRACVRGARGPWNFA